MYSANEERRMRNIREYLGRSRAEVEPTMRAAVNQLPESMHRVASYHLGWTDEHGAATGGHGGKAIRPALVLLAAQVVGGDATAALVPAAALELVHNYTLMHDDVMDGDLTRRHRATAWKVFGRWPAVLAGDALLAQALAMLALEPRAEAVRGTGVLTGAVLAVHEGQFADLGLETRSVVSLDEVTAMVHGKTSALFGCACELGALYGGGTEEQIKSLRNFGDHMGMAFQLVDDMLGIWGRYESTGKPVCADIAARKKSLPVTAALNSATAAGAKLSVIYRSDRRLTDEELRNTADLIVAAGGRAWAEARAEEEIAAALGYLTEAAVSAEHAERLIDIAHLVTHRDL